MPKRHHDHEQVEVEQKAEVEQQVEVEQVEVEQVEMKDAVPQESKKTLSKKTTIGDDEATVVFSFARGEPISVSTQDFAALHMHLIAHGISQKLGDRFTSAYNKNKSISEARASMMQLIESMKAGEWEQRSRSGDEVKIKRSTDVARAFAEVKGWTLEKAEALVERLTPMQIKDICATTEVAPILARLAMERAAKRAEKASKSLASMDFGDLAGE